MLVLCSLFWSYLHTLTRFIAGSFVTVVVMLTAERPVKLPGRKSSKKKSARTKESEIVPINNQNSFRALEMDGNMPEDATKFKSSGPVKQSAKQYKDGLQLETTSTPPQSSSAKKSPSNPSTNPSSTPSSADKVCPSQVQNTAAKPAQDSDKSLTRNNQRRPAAETSQKNEGTENTASSPKTTAENITQSPRAATFPVQCHETWKHQVVTSFRRLFNDEDSSDVVVLLGNERIYAHRLILDLNSKLLLSQTESLHNIEVTAKFSLLVPTTFV